MTLGRDKASDPDYLGALPPETVREMRLLGPRGVFEFAVALIASRPSNADNIWPYWLHNEGPKLRIEPRYDSDEEADKDGMVRLTERFNKGEWYSLMRCCADLHRGGIDWELMAYGVHGDRGLAVARTKSGYVELSPEDGDE